MKRSLNDLFTSYLAFEATLDEMVRAQVKLEVQIATVDAVHLDSIDLGRLSKKDRMLLPETTAAACPLKPLSMGFLPVIFFPTAC